MEANDEKATEPRIDVATPGEVGYMGYYDFTSGKTFDGRDMPAWSSLPPNIKGAWEAAARKIVGLYATATLEATVEDGAGGAGGGP